MVLKKFIYFSKGKKKTLMVKPVSTFSTGLLFKKTSPPLLFTLRKSKKFSIFSIFCKPFKAIWLDEKKHVIKFLVVKNWKFNIPGEGKYLLEIPNELPKNDKLSSENYLK